METVSTPPDGPVTTTRPSGSVSLSDFTSSKPLFEADSCLEFLILSLCNNLCLKPKQAAGLLVQEQKYLKRVMSKGLKGDFAPLQFWFQDIYSNTERLCDLLKAEQSQETLGMVLTTFQAGFDSPDDEIRTWTCRLLSKLSFDFEERGLSDGAFAWFSSPAGALLPLVALISASEGSLLEVAVDLLFHMSQGRLIQVFSFTVRDVVASTGEYLQLAEKVLRVLATSEATREEIVDAGVVAYWTEICLREAENILGECRLTALLLLHQLWIDCFAVRSDDDITVQAILTVFKRGTHDHMEVIRTSCCAFLFSALEHMAEVRSQQAPGVYKTLALTLVEEHSESSTAHFLLTQFTKLVQSLPSIPLTPLVNILSRKYSAEESWTIADIDLIAQLAKHERLSLQQGVQLIDICGRIYLTDSVFVRAVSVPLALLATRFLDAEAMQEYLGKFCKIMAVSLVNYSLEEEQMAEFEAMSRLSQRNMHVNLIKWLIQLSNSDFNEKLGETLHSVNNEYRAVMGAPHALIQMLVEETPFIAQVTVTQLPPPSPPTESPDPSNYQLVPVADVEIRNETEPSRVLAIREDTEPSSIIVRSPPSKASKSAMFPHRRVLQDLEKIKKLRTEREEKQKFLEEKAQREVQMREKVLRQQLEMRKVEQGLSRGIGENDVSIYPFGSVKPSIDSEEILLKEFSPEESAEAEMVKVVTKKYFRVYKALFQKYSGTGFAVRKESGSSFEWLAERKSRMTEAELMKVFVLFHVVPALVAKEDVRSILRAYCSRVAKQHDLNTIDFDGFIGVMSQVAFYSYSATEKPAALRVKSLLTHIRDNSFSHGIALDLFDEPDPGAGDRDVVRRLNAMLREDPATQLPSGYKVAIEQDVDVVYCVPVLLGLADSLKTALEILDEVICKSVGTHFLEGSPVIVSSKCAKGVKRDELPPVHDRSSASLQRPRKLSPEVFPHHVLSPALKFELARTPEDVLPIAHECAQALEAVLISVSLGMQRVINRPMSQSRVRTRKQAEKSLEPVAERSENWKLRAKEVHERMMRNMQEKLEKRKREEEAEQERKQTLAEEQKRAGERGQREKEVRIRALKEWNERRESEKMKRLAEEAAERQQAEGRKKEQQQSFRLLQSRLQSVLKAKQEQWKEVRDTLESQPVKVAEERIQSQQRTAKMLQVEREKAAQTLAKAQELRSFTSDPSVQKLFQTYSRQLETMFRFFSRKADVKLESDNSVGKLKLQDYAKMTVSLDIVPTLISPDVNSYVFKAITRKKTPEKGQPLTIDETDFREVLITIADLAREKLNQATESSPAVLTTSTLAALLDHLHLTLPQAELSTYLRKLTEESSISRSSREKRQFPSNRRSQSTKPAATVMDLSPTVVTEAPVDMEKDAESPKADNRRKELTSTPMNEGVQTDFPQPQVKEEEVQFTKEDEMTLEEINQELSRLEELEAQLKVNGVAPDLLTQ